MEELLKRCWRRRLYKRLQKPESSKGKRANAGRLGRNKRKKWTFRIKLSPKVRCLSRLIISPKKFFIKLRDKYVNMMLGLAQSTSACRGGEYHHSYSSMLMGFGNRPFKEYDNATILQFYKSFMAHDKLMDGGDVARS